MRAIVSLNSGSSSIKFSLFTLGEGDDPVLSATGEIEKIGITPSLKVRSAEGKVLFERDWPDGGQLTHADLLADLLDWATDHHLDGQEIMAIGHRVVHGGAEYAAPRLVDPATLDKLEALCPLAPLHQPHNLAAIRTIAKLRPELPQVACFDTAFHHDKPLVTSRFALPRGLYDEGIRRYGFHGLSYEYIARRIVEIDPVLASGRVVAAHLGNGASLCAMRGGKSIETTMGFTALDGLVMGTRCGSIDPGVILHLQAQMGMRASDVEDLLYKKSGLLGVSGISSDMRTLTASDEPEAAEAVELFVWRVACAIAALGSSLGGIDGIVFTAGIGENSAEIRSRIGRRLEWLGLEMNEIANVAGGPLISLPDSRTRAYVIPTDEERMIALHTLAVIGAGS